MTSVPDIHPTALIDPTAEVAFDAVIGPFTTLGAGVVIEPGVRIGGHCSIGVDGPDEKAVTLRRGSHVRSHTIVYRGSTFGESLETGHHVIIREGMSIGDGVRIGTNCDIQGHARIGHFVRFHSAAQVNHGTVIEDFAWIFPHVVFTNDPHPPSDDATIGPTVGRAAAIGARSLILPNIRIGDASLVAAGSTVTKDVEDGRVVVGSPARDVGEATSVTWRTGEAGSPYPWWSHFRRGYPDTVKWTDDGPVYEPTTVD